MSNTPWLLKVYLSHHKHGYFLAPDGTRTKHADRAMQFPTPEEADRAAEILQDDNPTLITDALPVRLDRRKNSGRKRAE